MASFRGQFVFFSATIQRRGTFQGVVPPLAFSRSPLIREAAARLLPAGLQGGRYYPCGFLAMSFFSRKLIDGAENCGVSTRRQCYLINLDGMPFADSLLSFLSTILSFFLSFDSVFGLEEKVGGKVAFSILFGWILLPSVVILYICLHE